MYPLEPKHGDDWVPTASVLFISSMCVSTLAALNSGLYPWSHIFDADVMIFLWQLFVIH